LAVVAPRIDWMLFLELGNLLYWPALSPNRLDAGGVSSSPAVLGTCTAPRMRMHPVATRNVDSKWKGSTYLTWAYT
jgi:hypothetical protein